jgi:hypothetical protein
MSPYVQGIYEQAIKPARQRFAACPAMNTMPEDPGEPGFLELFLIPTTAQPSPAVGNKE